MSWVAAAVVGGSLIGASASRSSAKTQSQAADRANDTQLAMFEQNRADAQPWREAGVQSLGQLTEGTSAGGDFNRDFTMADFARDPGYEFRRGEGQRGVEASAAARGGLMSGGTLKALSRYNQDFASNEFSNSYNRWNADRDRRFNRLAGVAGVGQTATRDVAQMGQQTASGMAANQLAQGNARAAGQVGQANAVSGGLQTLGGFWQQQNMLNQMRAGGGRSYGSAGMDNFYFGNGTSGD